MASDGYEYAWAAGFFDGEGCTSILKTERDKYWYIRMSISQKYPELLRQFRDIVGYGKVYKAKSREMWSWDCYKQQDCIMVADCLWEHLGERKRTQFTTALDAVEEFRNNIIVKGGSCGV